MQNRYMLASGLAVIIVTLSIIQIRGSADAPEATPTPESTPTATLVPATPTPRPESTATVTITFGGDVMLGRTVERRMIANGDTWPFDSIASTLKKTDLTIVNLESPFRADYPQTQSGSLVLRGYPPGIKGMEKAGIDAVSLANNHITDTGIEGLKETESILDAARIGRVGAGQSEELAAKPLIVESRGMSIGLLSYTYGVNFDKKGVYYNVAETTYIKKQVTELLPTVDAVIVLCHCGPEYQALPSTQQKEWAHAAIDSGASLFIGHHPHVPQPVEAYKDGLIIYSLGNLVFDQDEIGNRERSALAVITLSGRKPIALELLPYRIYERSQPRLVSDQVTKEQIWGLFKLPTGRWP